MQISEYQYYAKTRIFLNIASCASWVKLLFIFFLIQSSFCVFAKNFYVSPNGNDLDPGTFQEPFATISHAKKVVSEWNRANGNENITVWLSGGKYRLTETLVFGLEDGAKPGQVISYAALPNEKPIICSDISLTGWQKEGKIPKGLPRAAKGKVWSAKLPDDIKPFNTLFNSKQMLPRARTKGMPHLRETLGEGHSFYSEIDRDSLYNTLPFDKVLMKDMFNPRNAEIVVIPAFAWVMNILPVESVDYNKGMVSLGARSTYPLYKTHYFSDPASVWVENTFAGLDAPGKWVFDQDAKLLYYWPVDGEMPGEDIVIPQLEELVRIEGRIDYDGPEDIPVIGMHFKGITFTHGNRFSSSGQTGRGLQHDWELFDSPTALLRFRGAEYCIVENCTFAHSGGTGVRFDLHAQNNKVIDNEIYELGGTGILCAGYGPGTKDANRNNTISNNYIHHIGMLWTHSMGIWLWQSGHNLVSHNTIHDVPYTAIAATGRINWDREGRRECSGTVRWKDVGYFTGQETWIERERFLHARQNIIENNDLYRVMTIMNDGNGIYISGTGKGNVIRGNFVHDTPREAGGEAIRCDDDQHDVLIENNVVFRFHTFGTGICSKGCNHIINNIVACPPGKVGRGLLSLEPNYLPDTPSKLCAGSVIRNNLFYTTQRNQPFVYMQGIANTIDNISTDNNLFYNTSDTKAADDYLGLARKYGNEIRSIQADPMFYDAENGDFRLKPNSPALVLGFRPFILHAGRINKVIKIHLK